MLGIIEYMMIIIFAPTRCHRLEFILISKIHGCLYHGSFSSAITAFAENVEALHMIIQKVKQTDT